jgi:hypothetical protein
MDPSKEEAETKGKVKPALHLIKPSSTKLLLTKKDITPSIPMPEGTRTPTPDLLMVTLV